ALVKVLDFGAPRATRTIRPGAAVKLTPAARYLTPEQAMGLADSPDARTDQFALAALAYAMLTGRDAFAGDDVATLVYRIMHQDPPPLARFMPGDVSRLQEALDRALAKDRGERYASAGALARALAAAIHDTAHREPASRPAAYAALLAPLLVAAPL